MSHRPTLLRRGKKSRKSLSLETLDQRILLTSNPTIDVPTGASITTEDFSSASLPAEFTIEGTNVAFDPAFEDVFFGGVGASERTYLVTTLSDFSETSFIAEITMTVPEAPVGQGGATGVIGLFGMGAATRDSNNDNEPSLPSVNIRHLTPDVGEDLLLAINYDGSGTPGTLDTIGAPGPQAGTHRVRLVHDHVAQTAQFLMDADYVSGPFAEDQVSAVVDLSASGVGGGVDTSTSRLFFGGTDSLAYDDFVLNITKAPFHLSMDEGVTFVVDVASSDVDGDAEGSGLTYSIDDTSTFSIDSVGNLSFNSAPTFNAATSNEYPVVVTVTDSDGNEDTQKIVVNVTNAGNDPPIILSGQSQQAAENQTSAGTIVVVDDGPFALTLSGVDAGKFTLGQNGVLTLNAAPNFEVPDDDDLDGVYEITVTADETDGTDMFSTSQNFLVTVQNVNDLPMITAPLGGTINAAENQTGVATITANDEEDGTTLVYSLSGTDSGLFQIDSGGVLTFVNAPDFELPSDADSDNTYEVTVEATDTEFGVATQAYQVVVTDENDPPVINVPATVSSPENAQQVIEITFDGEDVGDVHTISIEGGADAALFEISGTFLRFFAGPDFESPADANTSNNYVVDIKVEDSSLLSDTQTITVNVTDINEAPTITTTSLSAPENQTTAGTVLVTDQDAGDTHTFALTGTGNDNALFQIDPNSGALTFNSAPDFEGTNSFTVEVTATDGGALTGTQSITVSVTDENDAPTISAPGGDPFQTPENQKFVASIPFNDQDNDTVTFSVSGDDAAVFEMNGSFLEFTNAGIPDFESPSDTDTDGIYEVTITASDGSLSNSINMSVQVTDVNEAPSIIASNQSVPENTPNTTVVMDVDATDPEGDAEPTGLNYSFTTNAGGGTDNGRFTLDSATGELRFALSPNFEAPVDGDTDNVYEVQITVSDSGSPSLSSEQNLTITVTNVNEPPALTLPTLAQVFSAPENQLSVDTVTAVDEDDLPGTLSFTLSGADADKFDLTVGGVLTFQNPPNFESLTDANGDDFYELVMTVEDPGGLTDSLAFQVTVTDVNDAPTLNGPVGGNVTVNENISTDVAVMIAGDEDTADTLDFSLSGDDANKFDISGAGVLTFKPTEIPDFENPQDTGNDNIYNVTVTVADRPNGNPDQLTASVPLTVTIADENEAPMINSPATLGTTENVLAGTTLGTVTATDPDAGDSQTFSITGGADASHFSITSGGVLSIGISPDFELPADADSGNDYEVEVTVTDAGGLTSVQMITVSVSDVNEAPIITSGDTSITENTTSVFAIAFTDQDAGNTHTLTITGGADETLFEMNGGVLQFLAAPDFELPTDADTLNDYEVEVTVEDNGGLTDVKTITVTVQNQNEAPVISTTALTAAENQTTAGTVAASDVDAGDALAYSLTGTGNDNALFQIDSGSGLLTFISAPDFETANSFAVEVTVTDSGGLTDVQTVSVSVTDENDAPMIGSPENGPVSADENQTAVVSVTATDQDAGDTLSFSLTGDDASLFSISTLGVLTFVSAPDFEVQGDSNADGSYEVIVTVSDLAGAMDTVALSVVVDDVNETPAIAVANPNVPENTAASAVITDASSSDPEGDAELSGLTYSLTTDAGGGTDNGLFTVDPGTGELRFVASPDFENPTDADTDNIYEVQISVTDSGTPTLSASQNVQVTVTDVNDAPVVASPTLNEVLSVPENQTAVATAMATDQDDVVNDLTFTLTGTDADKFNITSSGVLTFANAPNFESLTDANGDDLYDLMVTVQDLGGETDSLPFLVTVTDVNDAPEIDDPAGNNVNVAENTAGTVVVMTATDEDVADTLEFSLSGPDADKFDISGLGVLTFKPGDVPDFENAQDVGADNIFDITVTVADRANGNPDQLTDSSTFTVTVTDVNEAPTIDSSPTHSVAENTTAVTTVTVTDPDAGDSHTFAITGGADETAFSITTGGVLTFNVAPDFEVPTDGGAGNDYMVEVTATDSGGLVSVQSLTVNVTDVNESPSITSGDTAISENTTSVFMIAFDDQDAGDTHTLTITGGADETAFQIVGGELQFVAAPDFEVPADGDSGNDYEVEVTVTDNGGLSDAKTITVSVQNENEAPMITTTSLSAPENQTTVGTVVASDVDAGDTLAFSLTGTGNDNALFQIDNSGLLTFLAAPDFEVGNSFTVEVTVTDLGGLTDVETVTVSITDENDAPMIGSPENGPVQADENQTGVATIAATDEDAGDTLTFSLTGVDAGHFAISTLGVITFNSAPDFEAPTDDNGDGSYEITAVVTDVAGATDTVNLSVQVQDVNEVPSLIASNVTVPENTATSTVVLDANATDPEGDTEPTDFTYAFTTNAGGGADNALFSLNAATGEITFVTSPDFETPADGDADNEYEIQVTVTDSGIPSLSATQDISVTVSDQNDAPMINSPTDSDTINADENQTAVTSVAATDQDFNEILTYSLSGTDAANFEISPTGMITFVAAPDFETPSDSGADGIYDIVATVTDQALATDSVSFQVAIADVNEAPMITSIDNATVVENSTTVPVVATASDVDAGDTLAFSISGPDAALFTIGSGSGVIAFVAAPDFEMPSDSDTDNDYEFTITATDGGGLVDTQAFTVTVVNDNEAPMFTSAAANDVAENTTLVTTLTVDDQDAGDTQALSITGGADQAAFTLSGSDLLFFAAPDFENATDNDFQNDYEVEVTVTDAGGLTDVLLLTATVTDVNEAPAIQTAFLQPNENQTIAGIVDVLDVDAADTLSFALTGTGNDNGLFSISNAGLLTFLAAPNFETDQITLQVEVTATDGGGLSDTGTIVVSVRDVNDPPFYTADTSFSIDENTTTVDTITGDDEDLDDLTFSIALGDPGPDGLFFDIGPTTGDLTFILGQDFEMPADADGNNIYEVNITITDNGTPPLSVVENATVRIRDVNEAPVITSASSASITENTTDVFPITFTDEDAGDTPTPSITGGADASAFQIVGGMLQFVAAPDFEMPTDADTSNDYVVEVTVTDDGGLTDVSTITVNVQNENEAPVIDTTLLVAPENQTTAGTVLASDVDAGDTLSFALTGTGNDNALFQIDNLGLLTFLAAPDFEAVNSFTVEVTVTDAAGLTDTQSVMVNVSDENDPPTIDSPASGTLQVGENQTAVATLSSSDQDFNDILSYSLAGDDAGHFTISSLGVITFAAAPDFETPTDNDTNGVYEVTAIVTDGGGANDSIALSVEVTDVNEVPTLIATDPNIFDSTSAATIVLDIDATDPEGDAEGSGLTYSLTTNAGGGVDNAAFTLNASTGELALVADADFEMPTDANMDNEYLVQVTVTDSGTPTLSATQDISVFVLDINDPPVIHSPADNDVIPADENQTAVVTVNATDQDFNAIITYSLSGPDASQFAISGTGEITFVAAPDFEMPTDTGADGIYDITVAVEDEDTATDSVAIQVSVTDINEAPTITSADNAQVTENSTLVPVTVTASDVDAGDNLTFSISGTDASLFTIDGGTGVINFNAAPDFETPADSDTDNAYEFDVMVTDGGSLTDTQAFTVTVLNQNEAPLFTSAAANDVVENTTLVVELTFDDVDAADTHTLTLTGGADQAAFTITGSELQFVTAPDFETPADADTSNTYEVEVTVTDAGGLTDVQMVTATVTDINEAPMIQTTSLQANENQQIAGTVVVDDVDAGDSLTYALTGTGNDNASFAIDAAGELTFVNVPNFEAGTVNYTVEVTATDSGGLTDVQSIAIEVLDINDVPVFTSAANFGVDENLTVIGSVTGSDEDLDNLTFSIDSGDPGADGALFAINPGTGELSFIQAADFEMPADADTDNVYEVNVTITDDGTPSLSAMQMVMVTVADVNEAPVITSPADGDTVNTDENQTSAVSIAFTDEDVSDTHTFVLTGVDANRFVVSTQGIVSFTVPPNFESPSDDNGDGIYDITATVTDGGGLQDVVSMHIALADVNEAPTITGDPSSVVTENTTAVPITVTASDIDAGDAIVFGLAGTDASAFVIDGLTGVIAFAVAPDFENPADADTNNVYDFEITATDSGGLVASHPVSVSVINQGDGPTIISTDMASVVENSALAGTLITVVAIDTEDTAANLPLTFSISGGADAGEFQLNQAGELTFIDEKNFEAPTDADTDNVYEVEVSASDSDGQAAVQPIMVTVQNINDLPVISSDNGGLIGISHAENVDAVTQIVASDEEDGTNLAYTISGGDDAAQFTLDGVTGELSFASTPNFETPLDADMDNTYLVQVAVDDTEGGQVTKDIIVHVTDVSEPPVITSDGGAATVTLPLPEHTALVTTLEATDDEDEAIGGTPVLAISGGTDAASFEINASSELVFLTAPDFENPSDSDFDNTFVVEVTATDGDAQTDVQTFTIHVQDFNEAPVITSAAAVSLDESIAAVTTVTATDVDDVVLTLAITGGADAAEFTLDSGTGALAFATAPSFETPTDANADNVYEVEISATDAGGLSDVQTLLVTVLDVSEAPFFLNLDSSPSQEDTIEGDTGVALYNATDNEDAVAGIPLQWSIAGGDDAQFFVMNHNVLMFAAAPDFESPQDADGNNVYDVVISVADSDQQATTHQVLVNVLNRNEAPTITTTQTSFDVTEGELGVTTLHVSDPDTPEFHTWTVAGPDGHLFDADANGNVSLETGLDFDMPTDANGDGVYEVDVTVSDIGSLTDTRSYQVNVLERPLPDNVTLDGGDTIIAVGTSGDDVFDLQLGDVTHTLTINGVATTFDAGAIKWFHLGAGTEAATDTITVTGTSADDRAKVLDKRGSLKSPNYEVYTYTFDNLTFYGGGGDDYAEIFGTVEFDTLQGLPQDTTLQMPDAMTRMLDFARVDTYGRGGDDYAQVYGTEGADDFYTYDGYEVLQGPGHYQVTKGFFRVDAFGRGGEDLAHLFDTVGDDHMYSFADFVVMQSVTTKSVAKGFEWIETGAVRGGNDTAHIFDISATEHFFASGNTAALSRGDRHVIARDFDTVEVRSKDNEVPSTDIRPVDFVLAGDEDWLNN